MGNELNEEIPGTLPKNLAYFAGLKAQHSGQAILLYDIGNVRGLRWEW